MAPAARVKVAGSRGRRVSSGGRRLGAAGAARLRALGSTGGRDELAAGPAGTAQAQLARRRDLPPLARRSMRTAGIIRSATAATTTASMARMTKTHSSPPESDERIDASCAAGMKLRPIGSRITAEAPPTDAVTMPPSRPTPTAPPIVRLNWTRPVATARRCQGTAAWTMTRIVVAERPMPRPVIASPSAATASPPSSVPGPRRLRHDGGARDQHRHADQHRRPRPEAQQGPPADDRTDRPADRHGRNGHPGLERRPAHDALDERRHVGRQAEHDHARERRRSPGPAAMTGTREQAEVDQRLGDAALEHDERRPAGPARPPRARASTARSSPTAARLRSPRTAARPGPAVRIAGPGQVQPVAPMLDPLVQEAADQERRRKPDRRVDEEDPAPADGRRDDAADRRSDDRGRAPDAGEEALDPGPLLALEDVAGDREGDRLDGARRRVPGSFGRGSAGSSSWRTRTASSRRRRAPARPGRSACGRTCRPGASTAAR